jgi:ribosome-associated protein YbcJ (S4-like RNA binding protein)
LFVLVAPVAAVEVDGVFAENTRRVAVCHGDVVSIDEDGHGETMRAGTAVEFGDQVPGGGSPT